MDDIPALNNFNINNDILTLRINKIQPKLVVKSDSNANCNLTNYISVLIDVHYTPETTLATCNKKGIPNITINKVGYFLLRDDTGTIFWTKIYYAAESNGTEFHQQQLQNETMINSMDR